MQGYCDVYKWTILKRTSPEVKCLHLTSSRRCMCTLSVSNVIYHKFSHGAAFYMLNWKNVNVMLELTLISYSRLLLHHRWGFEGLWRPEDRSCWMFYTDNTQTLQESEGSERWQNNKNCVHRQLLTAGKITRILCNDCCWQFVTSVLYCCIYHLNDFEKIEVKDLTSQFFYTVTVWSVI